MLVGSGDPLKSAIRFLEVQKNIGAHVVGIIGDAPTRVANIAYLGGYSRLRDELARRPYELVYIAVAERDERLLRRLVLLLSEFSVRQFIPANQYQLLLGSVKPLSKPGQPMIEIRSELLTPIERALKRAFDIGLSLLILVVTSPLWLVAALLIAVSSGRPIFYSQRRVGRNGRTFRIFKFRTMIPDAEAATGPVLAKTRDPRITSIGRFLRATRIDELPQLLNVLLGQMSLVGPRPERPEFVSEFERRTPLYVRRLNVKPGLTGWAQVQLRYDATRVAPDLKLQMDMYYIENMSLPLDLKILFLTLFVVLRGEG
ncbi:MAG: sugar transferase [bacterium]|nr:sugar transferase [bacterium]